MIYEAIVFLHEIVVVSANSSRGSLVVVTLSRAGSDAKGRTLKPLFRGKKVSSLKS